MERRLKLGARGSRPIDRLKSWQSLIEENFVGVVCKTDADDVRCMIDATVLDVGTILRSSVSRQTLTRPVELIKDLRAETLVVSVVEEGRSSFRQRGRETFLDPGDLTLVDLSRPYETIYACETAAATLLVPKSAIARRIVLADDLAFETFTPDMPLQKLAATFLRGVVAASEQLDASTLSCLVQQSLDLFALMVAQNRNLKVDPSTHRAAMLVRIKTYIKAYIRDETLSIDKAAGALRISPRYINALLAMEGTSFGRYVLGARLEGAYREIIDPRRSRRQVTEVAFGWGFNNASHFGRVFKERYGIAPRDAKMQRETG